MSQPTEKRRERSPQQPEPCSGACGSRRNMHPPFPPTRGPWLLIQPPDSSPVLTVPYHFGGWGEKWKGEARRAQHFHSFSGSAPPLAACARVRVRLRLRVSFFLFVAVRGCYSNISQEPRVAHFRLEHQGVL